MKPEEVTAQILEAWDEVENPEPEVDTPDGQPEPEVEEVPAPEQETEEPEEDTEEAEEPEPEEEPEEEEEGEEEVAEAEEEPEIRADFDDPAVRAFIARYGTTEDALKAAANLDRVLGRQGRELGLTKERVQELEQQLLEAQAFSGSASILNSEQRQWVDEAIESGTPAAYVREAMRVGEFSLARAVCDEWGKERPLEALRASQIVDQVEQQAFAQQHVEPESEPVDHVLLIQALEPYYPELPRYREQMVQTLSQLGEEHPLVQQALARDPETAMRGIIGIYEIARASSHALSSARAEAKNGHKEAAATARKKAVVASAGATPSAGETPRTTRIGPGLTWEDLDREWESQSGTQ